MAKAKLIDGIRIVCDIVVDGEGAGYSLGCQGSGRFAEVVNDADPDVQRTLDAVRPAILVSLRDMVDEWEAVLSGRR